MAHIDILIDRQTLELVDNQGQMFRYLVSTGSKGTGQQAGSWQTPLGRHIVRAKIGDGCPVNTVFSGRRPTGEIFSEQLRQEYPERKDWILSRILWLSGTEKGYNRLGNVDTMRRFIYIHGSPDSATMGEPGSRGCIRMHNQDLVDLYNRVNAGIVVNIMKTREAE